MDLDGLLDKAYADPEHLCRALSEYGRELFDAGRPYSHYSETINSVGSLRPALRRLLTGAWDLAFAWLREEPFEHHIACPFQVLLALLAVSLCWGWVDMAGVLSLSWGGICRIGEVLAATRSDLVLPSDVLDTSASVLLRVQEPKTRFRAARHQIAKIEYEDLVAIIKIAFERLQKSQRLWRHSPQQLRKRFKILLGSLGLPTQSKPGQRVLDLGSMRAGGATFLQMITEDAELVRRRGRWLAHRTMDIYIQESTATLYFPLLPPEVKLRVLQAANEFPILLRQVEYFWQNHIPPESWYFLISKQRMTQTGKDG